MVLDRQCGTLCKRIVQMYVVRCVGPTIYLEDMIQMHIINSIRRVNKSTIIKITI